jgi:hypothetical protein
LTWLIIGLRIVGRRFRLHEHDPVGFCCFAAAIAEKRFRIGEVQDFRNLYVGFVPFENEGAVGLQNPEAFGETGADILSPIALQLAVLFRKPAGRAISYQMGGGSKTTR